MNLTDLLQRTPPAAWTEGDNIPWNEPGFSERMLKEHLSQDHDAASRRTETIQRHCAWIYEKLLSSKTGNVLDLGCGPGLYASRLANKGCSVTGIDFSPASIRYARETARRDGLSCHYSEADLRAADFGSGFDLVMLIYGEFNVFKPADAALILRKACAALAEDGTLLLEPSPLGSIESIGRSYPSWYTSSSGLFSEQPHLVLQESAWDEEAHTATNRYYIIDTASGEVTRHAASYQGYTKDELRAVLANCGFTSICFHPALGVDDPTEPDSEFIAITARKQS